jgi:hypothetical protein
VPVQLAPSVREITYAPYGTFGLDVKQKGLRSEPAIQCGL